MLILYKYCQIKGWVDIMPILGTYNISINDKKRKIIISWEISQIIGTCLFDVKSNDHSKKAYKK